MTDTTTCRASTPAFCTEHHCEREPRHGGEHRCRDCGLAFDPETGDVW